MPTSSFWSKGSGPHPKIAVAAPHGSVSRSGRVVAPDEKEGPVEIVFADAVNSADDELGRQIGRSVPVQLHAALRLEIDQPGQPLLGVQQKLAAARARSSCRAMSSLVTTPPVERQFAFLERIGLEDAELQQILRRGSEHDHARVERFAELDDHRRFEHRGPRPPAASTALTASSGS